MTIADLEAASLRYALNCQIPDSLTDNFLPVFDAGSGFMCIQRDAVERLIGRFGEQTRYHNNIPGYEQQGLSGMTYTLEEPMQFYALFDPMIDPETKIYLSEDYAFCRRWGQTGGTIWMDVESGLSHFGTHEYRGKLCAYLESMGILQISG
jgi:hypothetical protein